MYNIARLYAEEETYTLGKVYVYSVIVNQNTLHLKICLFTGLLIIKLDESILQTVSSSLIPNHLARKNFAKSTKYKVEILIFIRFG
jgi:hypothetical protein